MRQHLEDLNQRKDRLEETYIYQKSINRVTYERQVDKLNEQIMLAEMKPPHEDVHVVGLAIVGGDAEEMRHEAALAIASLCPPEWRSRAIIMAPQDPSFSTSCGARPSTARRIKRHRPKKQRHPERMPLLVILIRMAGDFPRH